jgi:hypothetical protein
VRAREEGSFTGQSMCAESACQVRESLRTEVSREGET